MNKFLTTPLGDFLKSFVLTWVALLIVKIEEGQDVFTLNLRALAEVGIAALIATIKTTHSWYNKSDTRFGKEEEVYKEGK